MAYRVPQFITIEDKFFTMVTATQLAMLVVTGVIAFIAYSLAPMPLGIVLGGIIALLGAAYSFGSISGVPFHRVAGRFFRIISGLRVYTYQTAQPKSSQTEAPSAARLEEMKKQLEAEHKALEQKKTPLDQRTWQTNPDNPYKNFPLPPFRRGA